MSDYAALAETLTAALGLQRPPIAVTFRDDKPVDIKPTQARVAAGCVFWELASERTFSTVARDHARCAVGVHTHRLADPPAADLAQALAVMGELDYLREDELAQVAVLEHRSRYVAYGPLREAATPPSAVLLFLDSAQGLVLAEAARRVDATPAPALGRPACAAIPQAVNTGKAALSLGCCGARAYLDGFTDEVALWVLPGGKLTQYAEAVAALGRANEALGRFHRSRRDEIAAGGDPSFKASLDRFAARESERP